MSIIYRPTKPDDLPQVVAIRALASSEVRAKYGFGVQKKPEVFSPDSFYAFALDKEPGGFWIAEEDDEIVGMAIRWVRDSFWFLSYLFVAPHYQERKVGHRLLEIVLHEGIPSAVNNRGVITYAYNTASIGLYMIHGMYARESLYRMTGRSTLIKPHSRAEHPLDYEKLGPGPEAVSQLTSIDAQALGFSRHLHHEYLLQRQDGTCYAFKEGRSIVAYGYVWSDGQVGPFGTLSPSVFPRALQATFSLAASTEAKEVSILVPGSNDLAMRIALSYRFRVREPYILMSSKPFGDWQRYLFHSPPLL
ncbi:MAG: Acetyltransferase (GNAT) family protein [Syntrophorhabdus sp. PtaU1.Bin002]|nr:MAG: Acetyltransferase (GNAT) family protein [Syntrophorhabdus sp. PtaU1.Bin002]